MPTTVDIIIKGVALCYIKDNIWKVLFPFNECHSVKFSYRKNDEQLVKVGHLAMAKCRVAISISSNRQPSAESTLKFRESVLDLTQKDQNKPRKTHDRLAIKSDWDKKAVLLTIPNAEMSVFDYIQDYTDEDIFLTEGNAGTSGTSVRIETLLAHWFKARIILNAGETFTGETLRVTFNGIDLVEPAPTGADNALYTLYFDNDCMEVKENQNDMDMLYKIIEDPGNRNRKFRITGNNKSGNKIVPPSLDEGKPCMAVIISDPRDPSGELP